jgi:CHASE3 domain sensor protein
MQQTTFKIRRKIILAFLFSLLSVLIFSAFSFRQDLYFRFNVV